MIVRSTYLTQTTFNFYVQKFMDEIDYIWLANNYNKYYFIINNEQIEDLKKLILILETKQKNPPFDYHNNLIFMYQNENQLEMINKLGMKAQAFDDQIKQLFQNDFQPQRVERPPWAYNDHLMINDYFITENLKILILTGLEHNWNMIAHLKNNIYCYVTWPCYYDKWNFEFCRNTLYTLNKDYNLKNINWLIADFDGLLWSFEYGFNSFLCNQNCWLNSDIYQLKESTEKIYDMVMNCRPERKCKRPYLARMVDNLAYIKGRLYTPEDFYDYSELKLKYVNLELIGFEEIINIYNQSICGGIFSEKEGACYSSSEYLLCGLPVVSTYSRGGRCTWYNQENSIIVEANEEAVNQAVQSLIAKKESGLIDSNKIRQDHINLAQKMRNRFNHSIQNLFHINNLNIDAEQYFKEHYFNKMEKVIDTNILIDLIK